MFTREIPLSSLVTTAEEILLSVQGRICPERVEEEQVGSIRHQSDSPDSRDLGCRSLSGRALCRWNRLCGTDTPEERPIGHSEGGLGHTTSSPSEWVHPARRTNTNPPEHHNGIPNSAPQTCPLCAPVRNHGLYPTYLSITNSAPNRLPKTQTPQISHRGQGLRILPPPVFWDLCV
ncbi:predicted protein [Coccidioides posadasii str. Silveira]|uniref:Predicted protein n=2 Tax=Coccidioides posadasii TaxID=199306 RepID=E9D4B9_COCPS|nr:predicted protein [Coccidioides posadasii str. Silveira]KMM71253.1 hypothetical protein CPAG_07560 [Coccidioides posadasii RMSCC 3488]